MIWWIGKVEVSSGDKHTKKKDEVGDVRLKKAVLVGGVGAGDCGFWLIEKDLWEEAKWRPR